MAMTPAQFVGAPPPLPGKITATRQHFQAMDNFFQVFAVRPGERLLMLTDPLLDPGVVHPVTGQTALQLLTRLEATPPVQKVSRLRHRG